ncbi:hypothetical protein [Microbulbifer aggregans]|uniref:hypothetical protein n=1 Tax=Microbulbifer aggregans TaxID=1769779 RepID=UPI001CFED8EE|nr:hypothetical protein [Microbulbifer aggregans]
MIAGRGRRAGALGGDAEEVKEAGDRYLILVGEIFLEIKNTYANNEKNLGETMYVLDHSRGKSSTNTRRRVWWIKSSTMAGLAKR